MRILLSTQCEQTIGIGSLRYIANYISLYSHKGSHTGNQTLRYYSYLFILQDGYYGYS